MVGFNIFFIPKAGFLTKLPTSSHPMDAKFTIFSKGALGMPSYLPDALAAHQF